VEKEDNNQVESLLKQVEEREEELIRLVSDLISYPTIAPPARNTADIQQYIESYLRAAGMAVDKWESYPGDWNIVAKKEGTDRTKYHSLLLNGHVDVATVEEEEKSQWKYAPFSPVVEERTLYGRGAADMKGGLGACLFALRLLHDHGIELKGDVLLEAVTGEEVGEAGTKQCCERGYTADYALVADTSNCRVHGQGGVITGWITVKSDSTHHDGTRRNMIHAGGGLKGASAIEKMAKLIAALQELERHWAVTKSYPGFPPGTNTINPAVIEGGRHPAFIADECRLWVTVHFYPNESAEEVANEIEAHLLATAKADVWLKDHLPTFTWGGASMIEDKGEVFPAFSIDEAHPALSVLKTVHQTVFEAPLEIEMSTSVNDGGWLAEYGMTTICYGPGKLAHAHGVNEQLDINELVRYTKALVAFIYKWCNTEKRGE
jgi:formylaminopyrimidine deformylase